MKSHIHCLSALLISGLLVTSAFAAPVMIDRIEASVNNSIVLNSDIDHFRRTESLRKQLDPLYSNTALAAKGASATDAEVIAFLTDEALIVQQFPVTDAEVEQQINTIQANNKIDRGTLKTALAQQGFSFEDYFELIRTATSKQHLIDRDIRTKASVTENDIKNYYYNHMSKAPGAHRAYNIRLIYVSPKSYKTPAALKEAIQRAQSALKGGENFEEVARRTSDDASAESGGDLGTLTEDQMNETIRDQVKKLQIGQTSEIFGSSSQGYYIIKLVDVKSEDTSRLDKMKDEIRNQLYAVEYQRQVQLWLERQRQLAFIHRAGQPSLESRQDTGQ